MRVDCGDRRDVILLTGANGDVGGRQSSAHYNFRIGKHRSFARAATWAVFFVKELLLQVAI